MSAGVSPQTEEELYLSRCAPGGVSAVTFDVWSTLLDINAFYRAAARALAELTGRAEQEELQRLQRAYACVKAARRRGLIDESDVVRSSTQIALKELGGLTEYEVYWAFARAVNTVDVGALVLEGAREALEELRRAGYKLAVVSNVVFWPGYLTRAVLDRAGLSGFFRVQVYADEVKCLKPHPRIFAEALRLVRAEPSSSAHVGDSPFEDLAGALASDMAGVLVARDRSTTLMDAKLRVAVVRSLLEVPPAVRALTGAGGP